MKQIRQLSCLHLVLLVLTSGAAAPSSLDPQRHELWQTGRSLVASIRVASLTSVFSPAVCLSKCQVEGCTLLTLAVTSYSSGERLDCHLTNVTDWLINADVYLEPCNQAMKISCNTFVAIRMPHFYFPLNSGNQLQDLGSLRLPGRQRTLRYGLGSQSGNLFTCTGPSGNPHVKYLMNNLDTKNYLITNLNEQWQPTQGLTLAMWVMFPGSPTVGPMFEFYNNYQLDHTDDHFWFWLYPGQLFYCDEGVRWYYSSLMNISPRQWHHVAMTWNRSGELLFYLNATQVYQATNTGTITTGMRPSYLLVGSRTQIQDKRSLGACLAHAIVHSETMSQTQLQHLMLTQLALP